MTLISKVLDLIHVVSDDLSAHGNDPTRPGFQTLAVHRFGTFVHTLPRSLARTPLVAAYRAGYIFCRNFYGIELPYSAKVGTGVVFEHQGGIVIHGASVIGDNCIIRQGVTLGNRHLNEPLAAPHLGTGVNVGAGAKLLGGITIGDQVNIGANSVVLHNVAELETVVGIPARPLPSRTLEVLPPTRVTFTSPAFQPNGVSTARLRE
jgi:serine O-acetyltransferase